MSFLPWIGNTTATAAPKPTPPRPYRCPLCLPSTPGGPRLGVHKVSYADVLVCDECRRDLDLPDEVLSGVG